MIDKYPVTIEINGIELVALKKLSLANHALATRLQHSASQELKCLIDVLDDIIRQIDINRASAPPARAGAK